MSDDFKIQLNIRIDGEHLLNIRSDSTSEFGDMVAHCVENADLLQTACRALEGKKAAPPVPTPRQAVLMSPRATSGQEGPEVVKLVAGVQQKTGARDGTPFRTPMYVATFGDGSSASTFDQLDGQALSTLVGSNVYIRLAPRGKYMNIVKGSVRSAAS